MGQKLDRNLLQTSNQVMHHLKMSDLNIVLVHRSTYATILLPLYTLISEPFASKTEYGFSLVKKSKSSPYVFPKSTSICGCSPSNNSHFGCSTLYSSVRELPRLV